VNVADFYKCAPNKRVTLASVQETKEGTAMRWILSLVVLLLTAVAQGADPAADGLAELRWLVGEWRGVGQGDPGTSGSERHTDSYLDGQYLRSQGRSVYPKQEKNPNGEVHAQLDLWSYDKARASIVLRQFDTLGFVGTYVLDQAASGPGRWVLVAESLENVPQGWKARYVFTRKSDDEYHEMLELDPDGKGFQPYVTNRFLRVTS
jgi:hypothetical protein